MVLRQVALLPLPTSNPLVAGKGIKKLRDVGAAIQTRGFNPAD